MTRHPRDPAAQHEAAATLGRMEADGLLPPGEAAQTLRVIVQTAQRNAPDVDARGLRARLVWSARDAREDRQRQRRNLHIALRWATTKLIEQHAPPDMVMQAALRAAGDLMAGPELMAFLEQEWDRQHGRKRR